MIFNLKYEKDREKFKELVRKYYEENATIEISKKRAKRGIAQNRYLHLILGWFALEYGCTIDEVKVEFFKKTCNREIFERENPKRPGTHVLRSTRDLNTLEMTTAIERFRNYSAGSAGIYLPSPNEQEFLSHIEREISNNLYV